VCDLGVHCLESEEKGKGACIAISKKERGRVLRQKKAERRKERKGRKLSGQGQVEITPENQRFRKVRRLRPQAEGERGEKFRG